MRLGEIKQKLDRAISDQGSVVLKSKAVFNGQAQEVENYAYIVDVLLSVATFSWSDLETSEIKEQLLSKYTEDEMLVVLSQEDFNKLNTYVAKVNQKLPVFYSMLEAVVEDQDEQVINIKLPENIKSIQDLEKFNKNLLDLFKKFNLSGEFEFQGFDCGTSWYEILLKGKTLYKYFVACLDVALKVFDLKLKYYDSDQAKLSYVASLKDGDKQTSQGLKDYADRYVAVVLEEDVKRVIENIGETKGKEPPELASQLVMATKKLVEALGDGVEFHLSFNPPEYAQEQAGRLVIDYQKMPKAEIVAGQDPKLIEVGKEEKTDLSGLGEVGI